MSTARSTRPRSRSAPRPFLEQLEDRTVPATFSYTAPTDNSPDDMVLRLNTTMTSLQLFRNGSLAQSKSLSSLTDVLITDIARQDS